MPTGQFRSYGRPQWGLVLAAIGLGALTLLLVFFACRQSGTRRTSWPASAGGSCQRRAVSGSAPLGSAALPPLPRLRDADFPLRSDGVLMVYGDWCGWSRKAMPNFVAAAQRARVPFYLVEDKDAPGLIARQQISGYPTFLQVKNGDVLTYVGDRSIESLVAFAN